jgi:2,3-bisphosphoglycerate-dependent phosphoglycerate mutase
VELLMVRHGLPERVLGADGPADPQLRPEGRSQAERLAAYLCAERIQAVYSSPLRRALETADFVGRALGLPVQVVDDLAEVDRYSSSYVPMEELRRDPSLWAALAASTNRDGKTDKTGQAGKTDQAGKTGETSDGFRARVITAVEGIVDANPGARVVIVSHGGVMNAYLGHILGIDRQLWFEPRYASISRVLASRRGHRNVESLNEIQHLRSGALA